MNFPANWPEDCPPRDALDAEGDVFRIVNHDPPITEDVATHFETGRLPKAPQCLRCGLSVFRDVRDAIHQRLLMPKLGRFIAGARLKAEHGRTKLTSGQQPTHTTLWTYDEINRTIVFAVVREEK